ncbi:MAG: LamG-like jellyroll fold domain-containing protein [Lentisphaeria bacterium]
MKHLMKPVIKLPLQALIIWAGFFASTGWVIGKPLQAQTSITGANEVVLGLWAFQPGAELQDSIGKAPLKLTGKARVLPDANFGGILECFDQLPEEDKPNGASTDWNKAPTPLRAFTIEAWVKLKENPNNPDWVTAYLVDKTYVPRTHESANLNKDYFFSLRHTGTKIMLQAGVGLGNEVINFNSPALSFPAGVWRHLAFAYDGRGTGFLFADKKLLTQKNYPGKGVATPGNRNLSLGERSGSIYNGLPGFLGEVRILDGLPEYLPSLDIQIAHPFQRNTFNRMEQNQKLMITVKNLDFDPIRNLEIIVHDGLAANIIRIETLPPGESSQVLYPLLCQGKAGVYQFQSKVTGQSNRGNVQNQAEFQYFICNRLPEFMPVVMWGDASFEKMKEIGFTHSMKWMDHLDFMAWKNGEPVDFNSNLNETRTMLNQALHEGLRIMGKLSPGGYFKSQQAYEQARVPFLCQDRNGKATQAVDFSLPRVQQFAYDATRSLANNVGMFPALDMAIIDSEFRDSNQISFRPEAQTAFKAFAGYDIPELVSVKTGVNYTRIKDFPANHIINDADPILTFYRWFWGGGDGYPGFINRAREGLQENGKHIKVYWDPVVRCPGKWGNGGNADLIGHWTYVYPDPLVMGLATDEVFAMLKGGPSWQEASKMTQIIWYRSATTGSLPEDQSKWTDWEKKLPEARFITIPPDMLEIAFWQKVSRPVRSIQYHGSGSLWDKGKPGGYDFTNPDTAPRLASLIHRVIRPLGPTLLKIPDRPARVAMLESFTSQMFSGGATFGSMGSPVGRMHAMLTRAHLPPEIVYDESILRDGLDQYQILVMPVCPVLTDKIVARIQTWQQQGGIIVADETLVAGLLPDILLPRLQSTDKEESIRLAKQLRRELGTFYFPYADADSEEAIVRVRSFGSSDYLFAFNDQRTYGQYVGQYGKVMEKGLPLKASLAIHRLEGVVYDLLVGKQVPVRKQDGMLHIDAEFGPGEGRLYMITAKPITAVQITSAKTAAKASPLEFNISVLTENNALVDAIVPLRIDIIDPAGEEAEPCGWYAAEGGKLTLTLDLAPNDRTGKWNIKIQELASGKSVQHEFQVQ